MAVKRRRAKGEMSFSSEKEDESDTKNDINPDHTKDKYLLQL